MGELKAKRATAQAGVDGTSRQVGLAIAAQAIEQLVVAGRRGSNDRLLGNVCWQRAGDYRRTRLLDRATVGQAARQPATKGRSRKLTFECGGQR